MKEVITFLEHDTEQWVLKDFETDKILRYFESESDAMEYFEKDDE